MLSKELRADGGPLVDHYIYSSWSPAAKDVCFIILQLAGVILIVDVFGFCDVALGVVHMVGNSICLFTGSRWYPNGILRHSGELSRDSFASLTGGVWIRTELIVPPVLFSSGCR